MDALQLIDVRVGVFFLSSFYSFHFAIFPQSFCLNTAFITVDACLSLNGFRVSYSILQDYSLLTFEYTVIAS